MRFNPKNFKRMPEKITLDTPIQRDRLSPLILIKSCGDAEYGRTQAEKDQVISRFDAQADLLLLPWKGQYSTDVFMLTQQDLDMHYK
jgi:hypothetical protein